MHKRNLIVIAGVLVAGVLIGSLITGLSLRQAMSPGISPANDTADTGSEGAPAAPTSSGGQAQSPKPAGSAAAPTSKTLLRNYLRDSGRELYLAKVPVRDGDLAQLKDALFSRVNSVVLIETLITDAGLKYLSVLPALSSLTLSKTIVTDTGMAYLKGMQIKQIGLADTLITDAGLAQLTSLPLVLVDLRNAKRVTPAGIALLKNAIPGISILQ